MKSLDSIHDALSLCAVVALLAGCGTPAGVAETAPQTSPVWPATSYEVLHDFAEVPGDGKNPEAALIDVNGTLYGTTAHGGGASHLGTVFSLSTSGKERVLHRFRGTDGARPLAALIAINGTMYGTTSAGGYFGEGTVYSITTSGSEMVLYSFKGGSDGASPRAGLIDVNGTLYGTTAEGGSGCEHGCGTVFSVTPSGTENVLYRFKGGSNGLQPVAGLLDVNGVLYGTTYAGGASPTESGFMCVDSQSSRADGCGTVFRVTMAGEQKVLHSFNASGDGAFPAGALIDVRGTLFGTTVLGGSGGDSEGTVFAITTSGKERVLYSFADGQPLVKPVGSLIDVNNTLYGTANEGRSYGWGGVYSLTMSGAATLLHSFNGGSDGRASDAGLIYARGRLYGTTSGGGSPKCRARDYLTCGTAFALQP